MAQLKDLIVSGASRFIGPILGTASNAITASNALNAANAANATNATNATEAKHASTANSAGSAGYAASAENATNAANATNAVEAQHASTANSAGSAGYATKAVQDGDGKTISSTYLKLSGGHMTGPLSFTGNNARALTWDDGTYQQRILTTDDSTAGTNVFEFQQSTNTGAAWTTLMSVKDDGGVVATTFTGALSGKAASAITADNAVTAANAVNAAKATNSDSSTYAVTAGKTTGIFNVAGKAFNGSQTVTVTAADFGLSSAMRLIGITSTEMSDGRTGAVVVINGENVTATDGDVVIDSNNSGEYVFTNGAWELLGNESSYKIKQAINNQPTTTAGSALVFLSSLSQNENGNVTFSTRNVQVAGTAASGIVNTAAQSFSGVKTFHSGLVVTTATGALKGTASNAINAANATEAIHAKSAAYALYANSATFASKASSADYATYAKSASYAINAGAAITSSWAVTANFAHQAGQAVTADHALEAAQANYAVDAGTVAGHNVDKDVPSDAVFTDTWNANSKSVAGYVAAPGAVANKVWKTDANGNPAWRDDANTTYSAGTAVSLDSNNKFYITQANASTIMNLLSEGTSDPQDNDYYITQYAGGGNTTTTYHRRKHSSLYNYIKSKLPNASSTTPGLVKVINNLTSTGTTDALSAAQGKALAEGSARDNTKLPIAGGTMTGRLTAAKGFNNLLTGTGEAGKYTSPNYFPAKWTVNSGTTATDGDIFTIKVPVAGHDYGVFLSVDNGTNYYPIVINGSTRLGTQYPVNANISCIFESTGTTAASVFPLNGGTDRVHLSNGIFRVLNFYNSDPGDYTLRTANGRFYAGSTGIFPYTLAFLDSADKYSMLVTSNAGTGTSKGMNTTGKFKLPAVGVYYSANNTVAANTLVSSTYATYISHYAIDTRYSHNHTTTFTTNSPLYIECTIDSNGYWSPTTKGITQTLTAGNYYIYLGLTYSTEYQLSLVPDHPCYYYDGTNLTDYTKHFVEGFGYKNTEATASASGLLSSTLYSKLVNIATGANAYSLPVATSAARGGVKIGYTANGKNYPVQLSNEQMYVNVPWTDNNTTYSAATTNADGLLTSTLYNKLVGIATGANAYSLPVATSAALGGVRIGYSTSANGKVYAVQLNTNNQMYVNVPWSDSNTWRPIENVLTSDSVTASLAAAQGKALASGSARDNTKLPLAGGTMTGGINWTSTSLPESTNLQYLVGIDAFTSGGRMKWKAASAVTVGKATNADSAAFAAEAGHTSNTLTIGDKTFNGATATTIAIADLGLSSALTFLGSTTATITEGSATPNPVTLVDGTSVTASNGQVIFQQGSGEEFLMSNGKWTALGLASSYALQQHSHGNIIHNGSVSTTATATNNDRVAIIDASASNKITGGPAFGTSTTTFLRNDGTWGTPTNTTYAAASGSANGLLTSTLYNKLVGIATAANAYSLPTATSAALGGVRIGFTTTANGRLYAVALNSNNQMYVNIPWTDNNTTYSAASSSTDGLLTKTLYDKLVGIATAANAYSLPIATSAIRGGVKIGFPTNGENRNYAVQLSNEQMYVNVPWTDNNTTYSAATTATAGLMSAADKIKLLGIAEGANNFTYALPASTSAALGGTRIGFPTNGENRNYAVLLNGNNQMYVNVPWVDNNTTYTFADGTNGFTVTPAGGTAQTVTVTPSITNNVTGSGTSGYLVKFNGANTITNGPAIGTDTTKFLNNKGEWAVPPGTYSLPTASSTTLGGVKIGTNIGISSGTISVATGSTSTLGVLKVGSNITVASDGTISLTSGNVTSALGSQSANYVLAGPASGNAAAPAFRKLVAADIPYSVMTEAQRDATEKSDVGMFISPLVLSGARVAYASESHGAGEADLAYGIDSSDISSTAATYYVLGQQAASVEDPTVYRAYTSTGGVYFNEAGVLYGAAWNNDFAECRKVEENIEPGRVIKEKGDGTLILAEKRLERGCEVISDTFGYVIGKVDDYNTPIATSGRVLAYPYESINEFASHIGWPVCSGPNGTVSIMTEEEEEKYPSRIIGTISEVPTYETWGNNTKVNGRVWIRIR